MESAKLRLVEQDRTATSIIRSGYIEISSAHQPGFVFL